MLSPQDLFDLSEFAHAEIFEDCQYVWEALPKIGRYIEQQFAEALKPVIHGRVSPGAFIEGDVFIGPDTVVEPGVLIHGPTIIGAHCEIRHGAYIRGSVILGDHATVGHASELKNSILLNHGSAPHFAYVGDSILGNRTNLGAGSRLANLPVVSTKDPVTKKRPTIRLRVGDQEIDTGLTKFGAILGDEAQLGCNVVTNPGCIIGPRTLVYPLVSLKKGYYPAGHLIKLDQQVVKQVART